MASISTSNNKNGASAISQKGSLIVLVPGSEVGQVQLENLTAHKTTFLKAHANPILCLTLNAEGTLGASSSDYGTVIRVFSCATLEILHELRRGTISASMSSLIFSKDSVFLVAASNKSTIHIWNLEILSSTKPSWLLPSYFQYQRSYFKLHINPELLWTSEFTSQIGPSLCMTEEGILYIAHLDGIIYAYEINNEPIFRSSFSYMDFEEEFLEDEHQWISME